MLTVIIIHQFKPEMLEKAVKRIRYRHLTDLFSIFMLPLMMFSFHFSEPEPADIFASIFVILSSFIFLSVISYKLITAKNLS